MPADKDINAQREQLEAHRKTLATYLKQKALLGFAYTPPGVIHGIDQAREHIRRIKSTLRSSGVVVEDSPDDEASDMSVLDLRASLFNHFRRNMRQASILLNQDLINKDDSDNLAISIFRCKGFQSQQSEILEILRSENNGFFMALEKIYWHDDGSTNFMQLEQTLKQIPALARSVPWSLVFKLLALLERITRRINIDEEIRSWYYKHIRDSGIGAGGQGIKMQKLVIEDLHGRTGDILIEFVYYLGGIRELYKFRDEFRDWLREIEAIQGYGQDTYEFVDESRPQNTGRNTRLLLLFEQIDLYTAQKFTIKVYFIDDETQIKNLKRYSEIEPNETVSPANISRVSEKIIDKVCDSLSGDQTLHIELALPDNWLFHRFDEELIALWNESEHLGKPEPLSIIYPMTVRSASRMLRPKHISQKWHDRWKCWQHENIVPDENVLWLYTTAQCNDHKLRTKLLEDTDYKYNCVVGMIKPSQEAREKIAREIRVSGTPVALWYHGPRTNVENLRSELSELLMMYKKLPIGLHKMRKRDYTSRKKSALGRHLTLLWDDPTNLPPEMCNPGFRSLA